MRTILAILGIFWIVCKTKHRHRPTWNVVCRGKSFKSGWDEPFTSLHVRCWVNCACVYVCRWLQRKQKDVQRENDFYMQLLQQALPAEQTQNNDKFKGTPCFLSSSFIKISTLKRNYLMFLGKSMMSPIAMALFISLCMFVYVCVC